MNEGLTPQEIEENVDALCKQVRWAGIMAHQSFGAPVPPAEPTGWGEVSIILHYFADIWPGTQIQSCFVISSDLEEC